MIALDTNILVYAQQAFDNSRNLKARAVIDRSMRIDSIVPVQVLGEFLNVCRTKLKRTPRESVDQVADYLSVFQCPATNSDDLIIAALVADEFELQFFDSLIITVARRCGATVLLSEDIQDGLDVNGLMIVNPFMAANETFLAGFFDEAV